MLLASVVLRVLNRNRLDRNIAIAIGGVVLVGAFGTVVGFGNPGLATATLVWIVAPCMFAAWVLGGDPETIKLLLSTAAVITVSVSVLALLLLGGALGVLPALIPEWVVTAAVVNYQLPVGGVPVGMTFSGLSTFVAVAPMWLTAAILPSHPLLPKRWLTIIAAVLAATVTLLAGRAAITVVLVAVPAAAWVAWVALRPRDGFRQLVVPGALLGALLAAVVVLAAQGNIFITRAWDRVGGIMTGNSTSPDDLIRAEQIDHLLRGWAESPLIGQGMGAVVAGYARDKERPWNFEMQYHMILFQVGIVGCLVLLAAVLVAAYAVVKAARARPDMLPVIIVTGAGALAMLIANASNPYLQAPGHMWAVYLVLMVANCALSDPLSGRLPLQDVRQESSHPEIPSH
jgi:hypothetical protein